MNRYANASPKGGVDVLSIMVKLCSIGGIAPMRFVPEWNQPRATGTIARHLRPATTAQVRRQLEKAERAGDVVLAGTGAEHNNAWNKSAAEEKELYWRLSDAAVAKAVQS